MEEGVFHTYWYEKNLQGDVIGVYNEAGARLISYDYDAWGRMNKGVGNAYGVDACVLNNPFTYRGYYYDAETGFYYLESRYYDPNTGRFINADGQLNNGLLGNNMYAYCENNPVMRADPTGHIAILTIALLLIGSFTVATFVGEAVAYHRADEVYEQYKDIIIISEGKVQNSYEVKNIFDAWALSAYIVKHEEYGAKGSAYGLFIEWMCHNVLYELGDASMKDRAKHLDFGKTVFSDFEAHNTFPSVFLPIVMRAIVLTTNPILYMYDIVRSY